MTGVQTCALPIYFKHASWKKLCATLLGFNSEELEWADQRYNDLFTLYTEVAPPEPIISHRLANVAILCMQYLHRLDFNTLPTQIHFFASWATKSKKLPWLWRRRMLMRRRRPIWDRDGYKCSSPRKLRRSRQIIYSGTIQSLAHQEQRIFYTWCLDLLYYTLRKAIKSDMLTIALSKPFIPSLAPILFPRRVKRVRKAAATYMEKVSSRTCLGRSDEEPLHS